MKVLLIDPPGANKGLNTGLGYIAAVLRQHHEVRVLDLNNVEIGCCGNLNSEMTTSEVRNRVFDTIDDFDPDLLGISIKTFTAVISKTILGLVKQERRELTTVVGGPHITLDGLRFVEDNKIDFGVMGEGENAFLQLCTALSENRSNQGIHGIVYWSNGRLCNDKRSRRIANLDALPFPSYDDFTSVGANGGKLPEYPLLTSRGCPYKCSYCSMPTIMGRTWRSHTPQRVIAELEYAKLKYHSTSFTVVDDNFTLDLKRVEEITQLLISRRLNLPWNSQNGIRADRINLHLARQMKSSGCRHVWIGVETADKNVFNRINKGEKLDDIVNGIRNLKAAGIKVGGFFIVGLPHSTRQTDLKSVDFVKRHGINGWWFNFVPYPHTEALNWVQKHGRLLRDRGGVLQYGAEKIEPVFETEEYPENVRVETYEEIHVRLRYFDRLVGPSLKQREKWRRLFKKVRPYGFRTVFALLVFIIKYNVKLAIEKCQRRTIIFPA